MTVDNVTLFPGAIKSHDGGDGGSGPEDPMLERRVEILESSISELRADIRDTRDRTGKIEERLARIEGGFVGINAKLDALPTVWTFTIALMTAVIASAGVSFAIIRIALQ